MSWTRMLFIAIFTNGWKNICKTLRCSGILGEYSIIILNCIKIIGKPIFAERISACFIYVNMTE